HPPSFPTRRSSDLTTGTIFVQLRNVSGTLFIPCQKLGARTRFRRPCELTFQHVLHSALSRFMQPGSIVAFRKREWVVLPSDRSDLVSLRPLTGATDATISIHKQLEDLIAYSLPEERIRSAN